ncbi:hypothetical protein L9F63_016031 [Diploptera punctata]|uniref:Medium-chain acyl-CoA ligase ACSF2, mitochondrial n=1 Tax=Diploptera punctata TaxID=6984 RepID=A0AAD8A3T5_DIPPU|nr:hypothetical protein L9F63_016031 [Diploptera punctata]
METYKLSYMHNPGTKPLCALTIGQTVSNAVKKWKNKEALVSIYQNQRFTFGEICDKADKLAAGLTQLGLKPSDMLGIWGPNSSEWFISRLAAARGGFIVVQIDPAYQAPQLEYSINQVEIKILISTEFYKSNNCYDILCNTVPELNTCPDNAVELKCTKVPSLKRIIMMCDKQYKGTHQFNDIINSASPESIEKINEQQNLIQPDDGCAIQFSSGTTGKPKGVLLSHHNLVNNVINLADRMNIQRESKILITTQFCHTAATVFGILTGVVTGAAIVIPYPVFDSVKMLQGIIAERCTHMYAIPFIYTEMIEKLKEQNFKSITSLECALYGGAPCFQQLAMDIKETLNVKHLVPAYGMTEVCGVFYGKLSDTLEQSTATLGCITEHVEVKVVDKAGCIVPIGTPGELWVRGYNVMLKYLGDEEKTRQFIRHGRWANTGDVIILQEDGYAKFVGRSKDIIIRIVDNIFPTEIEEFFTLHPDVLEAEAFGVPDSKVGEEICIYLRLREGVKLSEDDIREYCKDKLPEYKIPRYIRFVKDFERTLIGKVKKAKLLEKLLKELETK